MLLKQITLAAALAATFIAGSAAVANAGNVGNGGPQSATDEAALQRNYRNGAWAGRNSYGYAQNSYGYARPDHRRFGRTHVKVRSRY